MDVIINTYNVELRPEEKELGYVKSFMMEHLVKENDEAVVKHKYLDNEGVERSKSVGKKQDISLYSIWNGTGFLMPICIWNIVGSQLSSKGIKINIIKTTPRVKARPATFKLTNGFAPRPYQDVVLNFLDCETPTPNKLVAMPTGTGKALPLSMVIPTPSGPTVWGKLRPGDHVYGRDGKPTMVTATYPQGVIPSFSVHFNDDTILSCSGDHLWSVYIDENTELITLTTEGLSILAHAGRLISLPDMTGPTARRHTLEPHTLDMVWEYSDPERDGVYLTKLKPQADLIANTIRSAGKICRIDRTLEGYEIIILTSKVMECISAGEDMEMMCITVEAADSLYLCKDYTVTHNTMTIFFRMVAIQKVTVIILRPFLMGQWKRELKKVLELDNDDILMIEGGVKLKKLITSIRDDTCTHKVYIISNKTYLFYLKSFYSGTRTAKDPELLKHERDQKLADDINLRRLKIEDRDAYDQVMMKHVLAVTKKKENEYSTGYSDMPPDKFLGAIGAGLLVIDEAHLDPHLNNTIYSTMGNIDEQISLSATYFSSDQFLTRVFAWTFPHPNTYDTLKAKKYIDYVMMHYKHYSPPNKNSYSLRGRYNHNKYEASYLMRSQAIRERYTKFLIELIKEYYLRRRKDGDKVLIFFQSLVMVKHMTDTIAELLPELNVIKYTGEEKDDTILIDADIIFATVGKAAVGLDLKNLILVLNFISILSAPLSVQILGRLRELGDSYPLGSSIFIQMVCDSIPTHANHANARYDRLRERTARMSHSYYPTSI